MDRTYLSLWCLLLTAQVHTFSLTRTITCHAAVVTTSTQLLSQQPASLEANLTTNNLSDNVMPFDEYLQLLKDFVQRYGHARVYRQESPLQYWVFCIQNYEYPLYRRTKNTTTCYLNDDRVKALTRLGFEWRRSWSWEERIQDLLEFKETHGHLRVPRRFAENPSLGNWVSRIRQQYQVYQKKEATTLTEEKIQQLESLGFEWEIKLGLRKDAWQQRMDELLEFQKEHGHCRVPPTYQTNPELAQWVLNLRQNYRLREEHRLVILTEERMDELTRHGFEWDTRILKWSDRLEELRAFAAHHGHVRVPKVYPENPQLGRWVSTQRTQYRNFKEGKKSKLDKEQVTLLEAVGFQWDDSKGHGPWVEMWEKRLEELKQYQEESKTFQVPQASPLSSWYRYQRSQYQLYKEGGLTTLTEDQILELEKVGIDKFISVRDQKWDQLVLRLKEFREEHGHCRVPYNYPPNPSLGSWLNTVRQQYLKADPRLTVEKVEQLHEVGLDFSPRRRGRRKES